MATFKCIDDEDLIRNLVVFFKYIWKITVWKIDCTYTALAWEVGVSSSIDINSMYRLIITNETGMYRR